MGDKDHDGAGCPRHQIGHHQRADEAKAVNGGEDDEGRREFNQSRVQEVQVEVPARGAHVHDEALVEDGAREPEHRGEAEAQTEAPVCGMGEGSESGRQRGTGFAPSRTSWSDMKFRKGVLDGPSVRGSLGIDVMS